MAAWIQSLSYTLVYALGQGFVVYAALWLVLKLVPATSAYVRYHLSLSALTILLTWFGITWWQQYQLADTALLVAAQPQMAGVSSQRPILVLADISSYRVLLAYVQLAAPWLSTFYIIGLLFMLLRLSGGVVQLFSLRRSGIAQVDAAMHSLLVSLKSKLEISGAVQLYTSAKAQVPMVIGFFKPVILLPAAIVTQLSTAQLEAILLHELAHIKRHDYLINILQTIAETILFFNPFVWMISAITRREREYCCDDMVLQHTREPLSYATALTALATNPATTTALAVAATGPSNYLFNRIKRIMEMKKNPFSYSKMVATIFIITAITFAAVWFTPSFAGSKEKSGSAIVTTDAPAVQPSKSVTTTEEWQLVKRLSDDHLVDEIAGFLVEKKQNALFVNGQQLPPDVAGKYLQFTTKEVIKVQVFPFKDRLRMHPEAGIMQIIMPMSLSSPCVQYQQKDGC